MEFRRIVKCSNCGGESSMSVSTELELKEVNISAKCKCGSTLQLTYNVVSPQGMSPPEPPKSPEPEAPSPDDDLKLDDSIFGADIPSDTLRDLMEE